MEEVAHDPSEFRMRREGPRLQPWAGGVGGLLREVPTGPPSHHCPPSEITSTEELRCGPGVTHI